MTNLTSSARLGADPRKAHVARPGGIRVQGLHKTFPAASRSATQTHALAGIDLTVGPGEFVAVVGHSGCGKSTLLSILAGLAEPTAGAVAADGRVALMFQDATLLPWLTAAGNIELALKLRGVPRAERAATARDLLATVRLDHAADRRPHQLSGGMRQRVALARCLAQGAQIVLMDEPLGALDAMTRDHLHDEIERISVDRGLTTLLVTHNMREAVRLADRVVLMSAGRIRHEQLVDLPRPRVMDSPAVATRAADLTKRLHECETPVVNP
jgi:NitT/TauT family transport system ATP-binding protein